MSAAIDPDDQATWPADLRTTLLAGRAAAPTVKRGCTDLTNLLDSRPVRAYHATRLLPHEIDSVRRDGLEALTPELIERRLQDALAGGYLTPTELTELQAHTVYTKNAAQGRMNQVCAILGLTVFNHPNAVSHLLGT